MKIAINVCYGGFHLSDKGESYFNNLKSKSDDRSDFSRHHPLLIQTLEELGNDAIDLNLSEVEIVELPEGLDYEIDEYDGLEMVKPFITVTEDELKNGLSEDKMKLLEHTRTLKVK